MEGDDDLYIVKRKLFISIHSLRMEGDRLPRLPTGNQRTDFNPLPPHGGRPGTPCRVVSSFAFQSTPSAWRETPTKRPNQRRCSISIHSLRMEGDLFSHITGHDCMNISIHSLRMEGDDFHVEICEAEDQISIHSLRMEGDQHQMARKRRRFHFNPLPPHGGRHTRQDDMASAVTFQSTPSAWRETADVRD